MCTVTFCPQKDIVYFTSNRDEKGKRLPAYKPALYTLSSGNILYPKDPQAGGTWIAAHENGNAIVFLNGAFNAHVPAPVYRKSRGLILLDLIDSTSPAISFTAVNLNHIEPFTAIIWDDRALFECRWDGTSKHFTALNPEEPHIWSSSTLYDETVRGRRKSWFDNWIEESSDRKWDEIIDFHQHTGDGDTQNDLCMNRNDQLYTVSISSMAISYDSITMRYKDLVEGKEFEESISVEKTLAGR